MRPWLIVGASLVLSAGPITAEPTDVLDQHNDRATAFRSRCEGAARSLSQVFRPAATPLAAIALEVRDVPTLGDRMHVRVRLGWPGGPILTEAHVDVATAGWVRFDFAEPLLVELDASYVIEWVEPRSWWACGFDDPYERGEAYNCGGQLLPDQDFNFRTWAPRTHWESRTWSDLKLRFAP